MKTLLLHQRYGHVCLIARQTFFGGQSLEPQPRRAAWAGQVWAKMKCWSALCAVLGSMVTVPAAPLTFQVNMEVQQTLGNFAPGEHFVELHGSFDGWGPGVQLVASATNANVYQVTLDIAGNAGSQVQYKFVINQFGTLVWENDGVGPGGAQNRAVSLPSSAETLPVVYFNNQASPPGVVPVTFQVNLEIQEAIGNFDPAAHTVEVHGSFDGWGPGITLSASMDRVYQGTTDITGSPGSAFEYKFVINQAGTQIWEGNVGPGGPFGNRVFVLEDMAQTLPVVFFNNLTNNPGEGIPVTFQVDMSVQTARGAFDPASGTVTVASQFNNWNPTALALSNSVANPNLYTTTVRITTVSPGGSVPYKFVANGGTWEGGDNRAFTLASSAQTLPVEFFDRVNNLGPIEIAFDAQPTGQKLLTLSWMGGPLIRLQSTTDLKAPWQNVPGTDGLSSLVLDITFEEAPGPVLFRLAGP